MYASGDSRIAFVGRSTRHTVSPVAASIFNKYEGSSVFMPWSTGT